MENRELAHYGILGMKWGVRRTPAQLAKARGKKDSSNDREKKSRKQDVKNRRTLSESDIRKKIERLKMEKQLKDLTAEDLHPGRKFASDILKSAGTKVLSTVAAGAAAYAVKAAMTGKFDVKEAAGYIAANPTRKSKKKGGGYKCGSIITVPNSLTMVLRDKSGVDADFKRTTAL